LITGAKMEEYSFLNLIKSHRDLTALSTVELNVLAAEIRHFLIEKVSAAGGHLASNLGAVELTIALHRVFDTRKDRIIFDVGHQSYVHKILTGRISGFDRLRKIDGLSGFMRPQESVCDPCITGHASNSVSVALGMARARTLLNQDYSVVAVIGDGALTGGMAYEALNDAGESGEPLIVILNDNERSISKNVGAIATHLEKLRLRPKYLEKKSNFHRIMGMTGAGKVIDKSMTKGKDAVKRFFLKPTIFENMGFTYLGPVDGHDISTLEYLLNFAKTLHRPVLIHAKTVKGSGYTFSEEHPDTFHGVAAFDPKTGVPLCKKRESFSSVFGDELCEIAKRDKRVVAITAAMEHGTGLEGFACGFPERFFDVGIAEEHAVAMAAGMARQGLVPVCAIYSSFLQRAYDMLIHDVSIDPVHVVFAVDRAGLVGEDGATHHGVFDVGFLRQIPGMTVLCPSNFNELRSMMRSAIFDMNGAVAVRYPRGCEWDFVTDTSKQTVSVIGEGKDCAVIAYGTMVNAARDAARLAKEVGINCKVVKLNRISPLPKEEILQALDGISHIVVPEDCVRGGCVGEEISTFFDQNKSNLPKIDLINHGNDFVTYGSIDELHRRIGLDTEGIYSMIVKV